MINLFKCCEETLWANLKATLLIPGVFSRTQTVIDFKVCNLCNVQKSCFAIRYFWSVSVGILLVFYQPIPKKNSVGTFWYCKFGRNLFFTQKGGIGPFLMHPSPLFEEHRSSRQIVQKWISRQISARQKTESVRWSVLRLNIDSTTGQRQGDRETG